MDRREYDRLSDERDLDRDGLPDRADPTPKGQDYYYKKLNSEQLDYLGDFADFPYSVRNNVIRVGAADKDALELALEKQRRLSSIHDAP